MMGRKRKITIFDVAEGAGVSRQTVSRVLNNRPDVAPDTRERVLEVIQTLGYQPSQIARSLSQGKSCTLGVVGYGIEFYGPSRTLSVVESQANKHGYSLSLSLMSDPEAANIRAFLNQLIAQHVDGVIWAVPQIGDHNERFLQAIENILIPIVCSNLQPHDNYSLVDTNNYDGASLATRHLIEQGYHTIGIITGPLNWRASIQRMEGWRDSLHSVDLIADESLIYEGDWTASSGYSGLKELIQNRTDLEAVFACNDQMALGVLKAASDLGKMVPKDLALIGYDNIPESAFFTPSLSTISQSFAEQGEKMVVEIERRIREISMGVTDIPRTEILKPKLIVRDSSVRCKS